MTYNDKKSTIDALQKLCIERGDELIKANYRILELQAQMRRFNLDKESAYEAFEKYTRDNYFKGAFNHRLALDAALDAVVKQHLLKREMV